ncbi:hypothetical protein M4D51_02690 [Microbacterium sp. p3-SID338]|uniref:hypothetical protein n=1 Tax=unclassified Microbacterium TaxID=2609290 RepID=UPI000C807A1D|nr:MULTISPECIES: hypothetical protein [unclassified Microbacterium]MCT1394626.1 hypothetical protein [Microbacterium sp. p3-SID338]PMC04923.1 hypothetical protein CJ226_04755 [Microbacterium sp. UMB0228]
MSNPEAFMYPDEPLLSEEALRLAEEKDGESDAEPSREGVAAHLAERGGDDPDALQDVPAGGAGADAGAGNAARVDPSSKNPPEPAYESTHSREPGVGPRHEDD